MTLDALIAHLDGPYAPLPPAWDDPKLLAHAHLALLDAAVAAPLPPPTWNAPRGVVIGAGGAKFFGCAWCAVAALRAVGCHLPVQFWHLGPGEMDPTMRAAAAIAGIELVDAEAVAAALPKPPRILTGWPLKPFAVIHCRFKEVIYIDADCIVAENPEYLFETPHVRATGAMFWPDLPPQDKENWPKWMPDVVWENCGMEPRDEPAFESGQFLIDREKSWRPLNVTMHINEHCDWYYKFVFGDKDTFHLAWRKCGADYAMTVSKANWHSPAIFQHDLAGQVLFQHCTSGKDLLCAGTEIPVLRQKDACVAAQKQLRELGFSGRIWDYKPSDTAAVIPGVYAFEQDGIPTRQAILAAGGGITPVADVSIKRWSVHEIDNEPTLVLVGEHHKGSEIGSAFLRQNGDGGWHGRRTIKNRPAVALLPLHPALHGGQIEHRFGRIQGWFDFHGVYDEAVNVAADGAKFVEVGCWLGRSSSYLATAIVNSGKKIDLFCVDTWLGSPSEQYHLDYVKECGGSLRGAFEKNMEGLPHCAVELPSVEAAKQFADLSLDFVFVDASHDFQDVAADCAAWLPKLKYGGILAGDDVKWAGVMPAVQSMVPASEIEIRGANWVYKKPAVDEPDGAADNGGDQLLFIPVINCADLLSSSVASVPPGIRAVVLDQSADGMKSHVPGRIGYLRPSRKMTFTQMQNYMLRRAVALGKRFLMFMHSDASCPRDSINELLIRARRQAPGWGVMFTNYDALCVFNVPELAVKVGMWDETFQWYRADCDYYHRIRKAGLITVGTDIQVQHTASATLNADPAIAAAVAGHAGWAERHYIHKWGGLQEHETFDIPYNGKI
jgi:hypothetical protein